MGLKAALGLTGIPGLSARTLPAGPEAAPRPPVTALGLRTEGDGGDQGKTEVDSEGRKGADGFGGETGGAGRPEVGGVTEGQIEKMEQKGGRRKAELPRGWRRDGGHRNAGGQGRASDWDPPGSPRSDRGTPSCSA